MAFGTQFLARAEMTQDLDRTINIKSGEVYVASNPGVYTYNASATGANNSAAQTQAGNYFNGANGYLVVGDVIFCQSNDPAFHILNVTANAAGVVTVAQVI